jgi:hypothetical protein
MGTDTPPARAYSDWDRSGEATPADWVSSDRVTSVRREDSLADAESSTDESAIIDVPEEPLLPPRPRDRARFHYEAPHEAGYAAVPEPPYAPAPEPAYAPTPMPPQPEPQPEPEPRFEPRHRTAAPPLAPPAPPEPEPQPIRQDWQPVGADGVWLPPGAAGSNWAGDDSPTPPPASSGRRRRYRDASPDELLNSAPMSAPTESESDFVQPFGEPGRRARSRHSAEYRDYGVRNFVPTDGAEAPSAPAPAAAPAAGPPPPQMAPPPPPEPASRHRGADPPPDGWEDSGDSPRTGGQSVAELLARLQVQPSGGGRRRRRED